MQLYIPEEFQAHVLKNYEFRMKRHTMLGLVDSVEIQNSPYLGYRYDVKIDRSGAVRYQNNIDCADGAMLYIQSEDAQYMIEPIMTELFCYDAGKHGVVMIDGYHWKLTFYEKE